MKVISLGWGVQSFTLAAMVALGELEPVDAAIHADTTHERSATYEFAKRWTPWLEEHGVKVVKVLGTEIVNGQRNNPVDNGYGWPAFPARANSEKGGMLQRHCTTHWKIMPMRRWVQLQRNKARVEWWIGISLDEVERMKPSNVKYITNRWPLIERKMTRDACIAWLVRHDLDVPQKSACVFCPFHNRSAWFEMKRENGPDWQKAIEVDRSIRKARPPYDLFVHSDHIPLAEIKSPQDNGQLEMFTSEECSGVCFV